METLSKIYRSYKNKKGEAYINRDGKPYERVSIQIQNEKYAGKWIGGFGEEWNKNWKVGDQVDIIIEQNGDFLNFSKLTKNDLLELRISKLEKDFETLRNFLTTVPTKPTTGGSDIDYPEPEQEEVPF